MLLDMKICWRSPLVVRLQGYTKSNCRTWRQAALTGTAVEIQIVWNYLWNSWHASSLQGLQFWASNIFWTDGQTSVQLTCKRGPCLWKVAEKWLLVHFTCILCFLKFYIYKVRYLFSPSRSVIPVNKSLMAEGRWRQN